MLSELLRHCRRLPCAGAMCPELRSSAVYPAICGRWRVVAQYATKNESGQPSAAAASRCPVVRVAPAYRTTCELPWRANKGALGVGIGQSTQPHILAVDRTPALCPNCRKLVEWEARLPTRHVAPVPGQRSWQPGACRSGRCRRRGRNERGYRGYIEGNSPNGRCSSPKVLYPASSVLRHPPPCPACTCTTPLTRRRHSLHLEGVVVTDRRQHATK